MALAIPKPKACADCGGDAIFHGFSYFTIVIEDTILGIFTPSDKQTLLKKCMNGFEDLIGPSALTFFTQIGWAKKQMRPDDETQLLAQMMWQEADARGIEMWEWRLFGLARNIFVARFPAKNGGKRIAFEGIPNPKGRVDHVWWMDNKAKLKTEFLKHGLAVAKGGFAGSEKKALEIFNDLTPPVIVKPHSGSGSRHTILHITNEAELVRAFKIAKQVSPKVIIEEELVGPVYRATVVDGKFVAAIRRDPPSVVGDGVHTIAELVEEENKKLARSGPIFSKIRLFEEGKETLDKNAEAELAWQKYTPESVPPKAARVYFHQKVNWGVGGTTCDVTDEVHQDNIELFERAAQVLQAPITGIDFIIKDISKSWKTEERSGILECNSMPFFDNHHLPFEGKPRNVAAKIWDMVTPNN